jgi:hypothetical protein
VDSEEISLIERRDGLPEAPKELVEIANLEGTVPDELKNEQ